MAHNQLLLRLPRNSNSAKTHRPESTTCSLKMVADSIYLPKDDPERPLGEDSHFISLTKQTVGVADGVGGWRKKGVDAGEYARQLMSNCVTALAHYKNHQKVDPKHVLKQAYKQTKAKGSSTACLITLQGHTLRAANVGDSGFMVIRHGKVVYVSPTQQSRFNCPYQLGVTADNPSVTLELKVEVEVGDVVVAATDGLLDNLFGSEIEEIMSLGVDFTPQELAEFIAITAFCNSSDKHAVTPFSVKARKAGRKHRGGKKDDITVIVAFIEKSE